MLSPGTLIDRYELVSPIGEGGMAQVWVARQKGKHGFEKLFAFKCIHHRFAEVPSFRSMFLDEARIAAAIEHPNVAQVFDLGEAQSMLYLVIEYVDGESLGALMTAASRRAGKSVTVPVPVALRIIADACAGLDAAHRLRDASGALLGVVHRDVSPQNILVSVRGDVKVIDFGIAHARDRIGGDTGEGSLKGKIHYMAPEQALRKELGSYTDVFGIGATLYRMLVGTPPFDGGNDAATLHRLLSQTALPPMPDHVPPLVAAIVERALEHDPGDRYASASEMQSALEQAIVEEGYVPDVATWVNENISDTALARRAQLGTRTMNIRPSEIIEMGVPTFDAELAPSVAKPKAPPLPSATSSDAPPPPLELASRVVETAGGGVTGLVRDADEKPRSMMDVYALVARASQAPRADYEALAERAAPPPALVAPSPPSEPPFQARGPASSRPPPPPEALPGLRPAAHGGSPYLDASGGVNEAVARPAIHGREVEYIGPATGAKPVLAAGRTVKITIAVSAVVVVIVGFLLLLPRIVRDRIIASAKEAGVELTVDRVALGFGNVSLRGVVAKPTRVPSAVLHADEIFVVGFSVKEVRIRGGDFTVDGTLGDVGPSLAQLYEDNRARIAGSPSDPRKITLVSAHLAWSGLLGEGSKLEANDIATETESHGPGSEDVRASVATFTVKTKRTTFGPWGGTFDRIAASTGSSRIRMLLDPPVPDGPSALLMWTKTSPPRLTVNVPRSQTSHLGLRLEDFGIADASSTELAMKLEGGLGPTMRNEGSGKIDLYGVKMKGLKAPVDVSVNANVFGLPGKPLEFEKTTVTIGPLVANVLGTITATDLGFRLDASWRALPTPCERLARAEAIKISPLAGAISDLLRTSGAARVTGNVNASGILRYDTKTPDVANATVLTHETCGISLFGL